MTPTKLSNELSVASQIATTDVASLAALGFKSIIDNRPDGEGADQPSFSEIDRVAKASGLVARYIPVVPGKITDDDVAAFEAAQSEMPKPIFAFCRTGTRSTTLWALAEAGKRPLPEIRSKAANAGLDLSGVADRITNKGRLNATSAAGQHDIVIVGGGAAGAAVAASLLKRKPDLDNAIIDPVETHYYQPGWTFVGAGIFSPAQTAKAMASALPRRATWIKSAVVAIEPDNNAVRIEGGRAVRYNHLVVCPGLTLNWNGVAGLAETLGKNGVTSNYRYDLAPYTWELVNGLKRGRAVFTQPPMPIKCAGAPQKAMYLSADHWLRLGRLKDIDVAFYSAGAVLFGVADYVPALMHYVERYHATLNFNHTLTAIDGPARKAWFTTTSQNGSRETIETTFDMIHVCPPQSAPDFLRQGPLADEAGWVDVDPSTLRHKKYSNVYGLGDATNTPNAKTVAAARKQAPVVAENLLFDMGLRTSQFAYDGYGSCPLTVERGKIVLAEFLYGGKLAASFPAFLIDGTKPSRLAWMLKERILPLIYWKAMLKGREWMAKPKVIT